VANMDQFEAFEHQPMVCAVCEAMCPEAVDGTLSVAEQRAFEKHVAGCVACAQELEEAQRGAAWMAMLKGHTPEPPAALLQRILAETTGAQTAASPVAAAPVYVPPVVAPASGWSVQWTNFRTRLTEALSFDAARVLFQPRLAMTAAMAFFSIALTLNIAGVRVTNLGTAMLHPSMLQRTLADAGASATRSFQNLPVVYKVESRVSDMRSNGFGFKTDDRRDPSGPFGPATDPKDSGTPQNQPAAPSQDAAPAPQKTTPQGKSELEFPQQQGTIARKGA